MNDKIYHIDYDWLVVWLMAIDLRKTVMVKWLQVLVTPVKTIYNDFRTFREDANYRLSHNSQVVLMEKVLNDHFDNEQRRIYIHNTESHEPVWFYEPEDEKSVYFYEPEDNAPVYFHEQEELSTAVADFVVTIPADIIPLQNAAQLISAIRAQVDYYKLYSKQYRITSLEL